MAMPEEHPFARFVRTLGRGAKLSRPLDEDEACQAMGMILDGGIEPVQLGAVLALWRYRSETAAELAGFAAAARARIEKPAAAAVDLDWPSFADRHRQLPWFTLAALLLAGNGVRILMHGIRGHSEGYMPTGAALGAFGIAPAASLDAACREVESCNFAYILTEEYCPAVDRLFALRPLLGVRTAVNTFARMLNPLDAPAQIQGVFHPNYRKPHGQAAGLLGQPNLAVFKGGGGEAQRNPEKPCATLTIIDGVAGRETWPAMLDRAGFAWRREPLEPGRFAALWRGEIEAPAPEAAIIGTAAVALKLLGRAGDQDGALALARDMWAARDKGFNWGQYTN